jgi:hypothetical protein
MFHHFCRITTLAKILTQTLVAGILLIQLIFIPMESASVANLRRVCCFFPTFGNEAAS